MTGKLYRSLFMVLYWTNIPRFRWYEGRRTWSSIQATSRSFLRLLAFSLPPSPSEQQYQDIRAIAQIVEAFSHAAMFHLRDESASSQQCVRELLPLSLLDTLTTTASISSPDSPIETDRAYAGLNINNSNTRTGEPNIPLSLITALHTQLNVYHTTSPSAGAGATSIDSATWSSCIGCLEKFTVDLTSLERIRDSRSSFFPLLCPWLTKSVEYPLLQLQFLSFSACSKLQST